MKLYELPEYQDTKIYIDSKDGLKTVIFEHIDGAFSYCWLEEDKNKLVHLPAYAEVEKYKDGYKLIW